MSSPGRLLSTLRAVPLLALAALSLGAKPCTKDPTRTPDYPHKLIVHLDGDHGDVTFPSGSAFTAYNPCIAPSSTDPMSSISGRVGVFVNTVDGVQHLRINPAAIDLAIAPFEQSGLGYEVTGTDVLSQDLQIATSTGAFRGKLSLGVSTNHGTLVVHLDMAGKLAGSVLELGDVAASMSCE